MGALSRPTTAKSPHFSSNRQVDDDRAPHTSHHRRNSAGRTVRMITAKLRFGRVLALGLAITLVGATTATAAPGAESRTRPLDFGANVTVFDPSMPVAQIQATLDATHAKQVDN